PFELVELGSPVIGTIEHLHAERGDSVLAGQVVVELESDVERAARNLSKARARMNSAVQAGTASLDLGRRKKKRAEELFRREALSLDQRDEIQTETELARLQLQEARETRELAQLELSHAEALLARRQIRAPVSGLVVERLMSRGEVVDEDTILRIAQIDPLRVEVILPAAVYGSIRPGMRAAVVPELPDSNVHVAAVTIVDRVIDAASGTFGVRLELPNPDHALPSGLHCQVRFLEQEQE
ncbi:MAG: efflux RND transporter periplasmic adaptor subunit, partial [Myxococcales bacterium]|nr:efflux RND transporter periplasmic adaptor subunit [Myxococcales bacterium]